MYPEFIAIYICLAVLIALAITILIFQIKSYKQSDIKQTPQNYTTTLKTSAASMTTAPKGQVVFCRNCAAEFDASQSVCPRCGTPR